MLYLSNMELSSLKVLNENTKIPLKVRRRLNDVDDEVKLAVREINSQYKTICFGEQKYLETVIEKAIEFIYYNFFSDIEDYSKEWYEIYKSLVNYIETKFIFAIQQHYHTKCGD